MRTDILESVLSELNGASADIEASAVVSADGLVMASLLPANLDEDRVGAMTAAMLSLGARTSDELGRGELQQVLTRSSQGYVVMTQAGEEAVVTVLAKETAKLGLVFLDVKRAARDIAKLI